MVRGSLSLATGGLGPCRCVHGPFSSKFLAHVATELPQPVHDDDDDM